MASTDNPRGYDNDLTHIIIELFANAKELKATLKANNIFTLRNLYAAVKKGDVRKHVRWKNGDPTGQEMITEEMFDDLLLVPSFLNWLQNCHGTLPEYPIDIGADVTLRKFNMFLLLDDHGRGGLHGDGTVSYDPSTAEKSNLHHKRSSVPPVVQPTPLPTPPLPSNNPTAATQPTACNNDPAPAASAPTPSTGSNNNSPNTTAGNNSAAGSSTTMTSASAASGTTTGNVLTISINNKLNRESQSKMAASVPSIEAGGQVQNNNFIMSDPFLDIDDFAIRAVDNSSVLSESIIGFRDFKEEFDFKVRTRWRRPSFITDLLENNIPSTNRIVAIDDGIEGRLAMRIHTCHTFSYPLIAALSANVAGSITIRFVMIQCGEHVAGFIAVGIITTKCGEHGCIEWGDHEDFMSSRLVTFKDTDQEVVLSFSATPSIRSCGILLFATCTTGFHPLVTLFHTRPMLEPHILDFGEIRHFTHHSSLSMAFELLPGDTHVIRAMNRGVIAFHLGGLIRSHRCWRLAQQLGFIHQLVVAWGDILPSTIALLKPTRCYKINGERISMMMLDFINSEVLRYWKKNGEQYLHEPNETQLLYYHRLRQCYLPVGEYHHDSQDLYLSFCGSRGFAAAVQFSITLTGMMHHPSFEDIIREGNIISERGEILIHRVDQVIRPWGDCFSCESYTLFRRIGGYMILARKHQSYDFSLYKFLVVSITHSTVKSSVINYLMRIQHFALIGNDSIVWALSGPIYKSVCSEYHQEIDDTDDRCIIEIDDTDERCIIDLELLRYCKMMSEDGENIYCVPYTSLDLTLITSVNYFDTGSSSVALARVYYCAILRNTAAVITSTFGSYVRTIGITTCCSLWNYGEPHIYHLLDCEQVRCVKCDYELYHGCVRYAEDVRTIQEAVSVKQRMNAGCSFKLSITSGRCNYPTALLVEHSIGRNKSTMQDIASVRSSDGREQLQLRTQLPVQVTNAQLQQVQVTSEIPFSNEHITSSVTSSDMQPTSVGHTNLTTNHHCNRVHPETNRTKRVNLREHTIYFSSFDSTQDRTNHTIGDGEVDGIDEETLLRRLSRENVRTNNGEKLLHMVTTLAGWGVSNRDGNEICGIGNASAFAPYLEMIVFRILRIGVSSFFGFRIFG